MKPISGSAIDLQKMSIFSDKAHFDLGGYASTFVAFGAHRIYAHIYCKANAHKMSHLARYRFLCHNKQWRATLVIIPERVNQSLNVILILWWATLVIMPEKVWPKSQCYFGIMMSYTRPERVNNFFHFILVNCKL